MILRLPDGIDLYYEKSGSGPPLILLHGNGEDHTIFGKLSLKLGRHFTLYALDTRGHGQSSPWTEFTYDLLSRDLESFITLLKLEPAGVAGFSDGAITALLLAIRNPGLIRKAALLGVNLSPADFREEILAELESQNRADPQPLLELMLTQPNLTPADLKAADIPILVAGGEMDLFKPEVLPEIARALPQGELLILPGQGHETYVADSDLMYGRLVSFFSG
jgi:pimeloyl-ACP methyl ester carboxylesterase